MMALDWTLPIVWADGYAAEVLNWDYEGDVLVSREYGNDRTDLFAVGKDGRVLRIVSQGENVGPHYLVMFRREPVSDLDVPELINAAPAEPAQTSSP